MTGHSERAAPGAAEARTYVRNADLYGQSLPDPTTYLPSPLRTGFRGALQHRLIEKLGRIGAGEDSNGNVGVGQQIRAIQLLLAYGYGVLQPIAFAVHLEDVDMVRQTAGRYLRPERQLQPLPPAVVLLTFA